MNEQNKVNPKSPYFEYYLLSLTLEKVAALREILREEIKDVIKLKKIKKIAEIRFYQWNQDDRIIGVFQALEEFYEVEKSMAPKYSNEEILAGIKEIPSDESSLSITIGKMFMVDPDIVLTKWQYIKILGILRYSYYETEYRKRLQTVYNSKQQLK